MAHPGGRPREHDRDAIAEKLVEWARRDDSINLNKFAALECDPPIPVTKLSFWAKECPKFRNAYESAKSFLAFRREEKLNKDELHVKAYDLNATNYDLLLKEERNEQLAYEASLKSDVQEKIDDRIIQQNNAVVDAFRALICADKQQSKDTPNKNHNE